MVDPELIKVLNYALGGVGLILSGGGLWAFLSARATAKSANRQANTADWDGLMAYWQAEIKELRSHGNRIEVRLMFLEQQRDEDLRHIDALEQHIWQQLPPPPPPRRRIRPIEEEQE